MQNLFISMFSIGESDIAMAEVEEFPRVQHAIFSWLASNFQQYGKNMYVKYLTCICVVEI